MRLDIVRRSRNARAATSCGGRRFALMVVVGAVLASTLAGRASAVDFVIAGVGDSMSAGEGNPERIGTFNSAGILTGTRSPEQWRVAGRRWPGGEVVTETDSLNARRCHNSPYNPHQQAAEMLQERFPDINVVFRSFGCSGATVPVGLLGVYDGSASEEARPPTVDPRRAAVTSEKAVTADDQPPQLDQVTGWLARRNRTQLDALLVTIGVNDVGFATVVGLCALPPEAWIAAGLLGGPAAGSVLGAAFGGPFGIGVGALVGSALSPAIAAGLATLPCNLNPVLGGVVTPKLNALSTVYRALATSIDARFNSAAAGRPRLGEVYLTEYPDPTRSDDGTSCDSRDFESNEFLRGLTATETSWAAATVLARLNRTGRSAAQAAGWRYAGGIAGDYRLHGVCADAADRWIHTANDSLRKQGNDASPALQTVTPLRFGGGAVHPTVKGAEAIAKRILPGLEAQLRTRFGIPDVTISQTTSNSVTLSWNDPPELAESGFQVQIDGRSIVSVGANVTTYTRTLVGRGSYRVRECRNRLARACSPWSASVVASNRTPGGLTNVRLADLRQQARITWTPADQRQTQFLVRWRPSRQTRWRTETLPPNANEFALGDRAQAPLDPGVAYVIQVRACGRGCGPLTQVVVPIAP